jgi:hypothetical protein
MVRANLAGGGGENVRASYRFPEELRAYSRDILTLHRSRASRLLLQGSLTKLQSDDALMFFAMVRSHPPPPQFNTTMSENKPPCFYSNTNTVPHGF